MDKNYHYYVTYTAAVAAGFTGAEALLIARTARYVDEDSATCQGVWTLALENIWDSLASDYSGVIKLLRIWPVFHFLPGQFGRISGEVRRDLIGSTKDRFSLAPLLICGTESNLTADLVNGAHAAYAGGGTPTSKLIRIGIAMHTLADTFAHQGFAGLPLSCINEVKSVMTATNSCDLYQKQYAPGINYSPAPSYQSFGYLGHGRIGHLPDKPGATYHYKAAWREPTCDSYITRYNPLEYFCAYLQMLEAMLYIHGNNNAFNNSADRPAIVAALRGPNTSIVEPYIHAFVQAPEDRDLTRTWPPILTPAQQHAQAAGTLAPFGPILPAFTTQSPPQYIPLNEDPDTNLCPEFAQAAADQIALVTTRSPGLEAYIDYLSQLQKP